MGGYTGANQPVQPLLLGFNTVWTFCALFAGVERVKARRVHTGPVTKPRRMQKVLVLLLTLTSQLVSFAALS